MKTTRTFASVCLTASCIALVLAANVSVGDQPGVFRMTSTPQTGGGSEIVPVPDVQASGTDGGEQAGQVNLSGNGSAGQVNLGNGAVTNDPAQFMGSSAGVTSPVFATQAFQQHLLITPQVTFEQNIDDSIGMRDSYTRFNAFIPNHLMPDTTILAMSLSASLSADGDDLYNWGAIYRHYDQTRNRIWGLNVFGDFDDTALLDEYSRVGFGVENLGRYIDFIFNGYLNVGNDSTLSSRTALTGLSLSGNNVVRSFSEMRENAYEGFDWKVGTPVPWLGRRGMKTFLGMYYLNSEFGSQEALGFSAQFQLQATESLELNAFYTNDEAFGTNSWFNIAYSIPHTRHKRILRPKSVRERLSDPVRRTNTIHTRVESSTLTVAEINPKTGLPWFITYVDPNATSTGSGTIESPYMTLEAAVAANAATVDAIRITPRTDGTGTNLTVAGGFDLFDEQSVFSSHKDFVLFEEAGSSFVIPAESTSTTGPLISNPTMMAGGSVIRIADWNRISGLQIDASNSAGTVYGMGIDAPAPFDSVQLVCNTFTNYTTAANLPDGSGELLFDENTFTGLAGMSQTGLELSTVAGTHDLRIDGNRATNNATVAINVTAQAGSTINADNPLGTGPMAGTTATATGITDNIVADGGEGIIMTAEIGATINAVVERNTITGNTFNGFIGRADGGTFNLASFRSNTLTGNLENGTFLHFLNGGTFTSVTEDLNGDGMLSAAEDVNGNGMLDEGIVTNTMSNNGIAGLCIFGEDASTGDFDIGGPFAELGNRMSGNAGAGIAVDLMDSSTAGIDALFNTITGGTSGPGLTIVLDFIDPGQGSVVDALGRTVNPFDVTSYGFAASDFDAVTNAILETVRSTYTSIPTSGTDPMSPIPDGFELALDFVIGDTGVAPSNGATEYYVVTIGDSAADLGGLAGQAADIGNIRNAMGEGPGMGLDGVAQAIGDSAMAVYTNSINSFSPLLTPPDALNSPTALVVNGADMPSYAVTALTSGNLTFTRRAIGLVTAHELGHTLSLRHILASSAVTPNGGPPIMGTPAFDLPLQSLLEVGEFAYSGTNPGEIPGESPFTQNSIAQLVNAIGTRTSGREQANGIAIVANDSARLRPSTFINNTISGSSNRGLSIEMNDMAVAEDVTIQGNTITGNGTGIRLAANGPDAVINADSTVGGTGMNTLGGTMYTQGNTITGNNGDGFQALASNGGTIVGNLLNNNISNNTGNGASLQIDEGGIIDFGNAALNRVITGNTFSGNGGAGLLLESTVSPSVSNADQEMNAIVQGNMFTQNGGGGLVARLNGANNVPPGPPAAGFDMNNVLNLSIGQSTMPISTPVPEASNVFSQNVGVGIGVVVNGNGLANVDIYQNTITGTTAGSDPIFNGDGINLRRTGTSLLLSRVLHNTVSGNADNGLEVDTQGTESMDPNQPTNPFPPVLPNEPGTNLNSVTWNNNLFESNGGNGVAFLAHGASQLMANGIANITRNNTGSGVYVRTDGGATFGDPAIPNPPDLFTRVEFSGLISTGNGRDGVEMLALDDSSLLLHITSDRIPTTSGAHAALNTMGDTAISNNGRDGVHLESGQDNFEGGNFTQANPDILIDSTAPAMTLISGNGTADALRGGNGIFWDSYANSGGHMQIYDTIIIDNIAGQSEDTNGDGTLTHAEDTAGNFGQNQLTDAGGALLYTADTSGNLDIDVLNGDGVQFNYYHFSESMLTVGTTGRGNVIQRNGDDGIALTGDIDRVSPEMGALTDELLVHRNFGFLGDSGPTGSRGPTPIINIQGNLIGGENDGVSAGNLGDGISVRNFGYTVAGIAPGNVNADLNSGPLFPGPGLGNAPNLAGAPNPPVPGGGAGSGAGAVELFQAGGPTPTINIDNNMISSNARIGVNVRLQGGAMDNQLEIKSDAPNAVGPNSYDTGDFINLSLTNNDIILNGLEGVFLRADADMSQNRLVFLPNFPDPPIGMTDNQNFSGDARFTQAWGNDFRNGGGGDSSWQNLSAVQATLFTVTGNRIESNGVSGTGHGLEIRVGTAAYVAADIQNNSITGNVEEDVFTAAFFSDIDTTGGTATRINTFTSMDLSGDGLYDYVYLDDTAQLDMRFVNNTGNRVNIQEDGAFLDVLITEPTVAQDVQATYTNSDPLKGAGNTNRLAGVFKIDGFPLIDLNGNSIVDSAGNTTTLGGATGAFNTFDFLNISVEVPWPEQPYNDLD